MTTDGTDMPHATTTHTQPRPATPRRRFNCFVDDTALIAGLKRSTRDGIKKWVNNGSIQVYVPLHTLERLRYLAKQTDRPGRAAIDAKEAIEWLDQITSDSDNPASKLVRLEAPEELFERWSEVESFMLPETLLSMESENVNTTIDPTQTTENLIDSLADLRMDAMPDNASVSSQESAGARTSSPISVYSAASPALAQASPSREAKSVQPIGHGRPNHKKSNSNVSNASAENSFMKNKTLVPKSLQPYFNHLLWRINQGSDFNESRDAYILVTNDILKQQIGRRFGIRCKRLEEIREIIAREERDIRNREQLLRKEGQVQTPKMEVAPATPGKEGANHDDDDDDIIFTRQPPKAPQAMNGGSNGKQVVDPNAFGGRGEYMFTRGGRGVYRGNGRGGRGGASPVANRANGNNYSPRNVTPNTPRHAPAPVDLSKPMDPDSYARPGSAKGSIRGGRRRLWEPT